MWIDVARCAICGAPTWPNLWRWCSAVYCSQTCLIVDSTPDVVPAYPFGQCAVGGPRYWEVHA